MPVNTIVGVPRLQNQDSQSQDTFLAPRVNNETSNYDREC